MIKKIRLFFLEEIIILLVLAVVSGAVLMLPSLHVGTNFRFIDALFTATSAITVTGLTVQPTGSFFTPSGKVFLLFLIEVGGFGIVALASFFEMTLLKKTPHGIDNVQNVKDLSGQWHKVPNILFFAFKFILISQILGFLFLWLLAGFKPFDALFHAVSAFNNAGFSTFDTNLVGFSDSPLVILPILVLMILGSMGFLVISELFRKVTHKDFVLSVYTKLVININLFLYIISMTFLFADIWIRSETGLLSSFWHALFQSVSLRTSGFNTIDLSDLGSFGIVISVLMMVIGGGSISMSGGIKTTTFYVFIRSLISHLTGNKKTLAIKGKYYIPRILVETASFIVTTYFFTFLLSMVLLTFVEDSTKLGITEMSFEVISALSTVGLSQNITPQLNDFAKLIIISDMFIGRLGVYIVMRKIFSNATKLRKLRFRKQKSIKRKRKLEELEIAVG